MHSDRTPSATASKADRQVSLRELSLGFLKIGLLGFGGVAPVARHVIVEDRAWLTEQEYASILGIAQIVPGANTVNTAVIIGDRFQGAPGALVATAALMVLPLLILLGSALLYQRFAGLPQVQAAIGGSAAAAAGLVIGTAIKMARRLTMSNVALLFGVLAFVSVGVLHLPLIAVVLVLAPLSVGAAFARRES